MNNVFDKAKKTCIQLEIQVDCKKDEPNTLNYVYDLLVKPGDNNVSFDVLIPLETDEDKEKYDKWGCNCNIVNSAITAEYTKRRVDIGCYIELDNNQIPLTWWEVLCRTLKKELKYPVKATLKSVNIESDESGNQMMFGIVRNFNNGAFDLRGLSLKESTVIARLDKPIDEILAGPKSDKEIQSLFDTLLKYEFSDDNPNFLDIEKTLNIVKQFHPADIYNQCYKKYVVKLNTLK